MDTITLKKSAYNSLVKRQDKTEDAIARLTEAVEVLSRDEVMPAVAKRLGRQSRLMDSGKAKRFRTMKLFRTYVRGL
jgi:hypothetical protein